MKRYPVVVAASIAVVSLFAVSTVFAGPAVERQKHQQKRIEQGIASGELTPEEAAKLEKEQAHIQREKNRMLSDGKLTQKEKAKLKADQDRASRHIYKEKHD